MQVVATESMAHCKVTTLLSEYEFGDLDYSQFRRRHASLHFNSGIQMCRRNKTISKLLASKSEMEQYVLLRKAKNIQETWITLIKMSFNLHKLVKIYHNPVILRVTIH